MEILHIENLTFTYNGAKTPALTDVSLTVTEGELVLLCGRSGCGKSTLLRLIKKELSPNGDKSGDIRFLGNSAGDIGFVFQSPDMQIVCDTVLRELAFGLENLGVPSDAIRRRISETVAFFGISRLLHKKTHELSSGEKQLVNLAAVMALRPKLLLVDEPTATLDPIAAENFISVLTKLTKELGTTVIIAEHYLETLFPLCDRVLLMDSGKLTYDGAPRNALMAFSDEMSDALPTAMRLYKKTNGNGPVPITVREGRRYLADNFKTPVTVPDAPMYTHSKDVALSMKDVCFRYEKHSPDILNSLSLKVFRGEHFCILGSNGSGKSTLLGIAAGVFKPYSGRVRINGKCALMPSEPRALFLKDTLFADLKTVSDDPDAITDVLCRLDIKDLADMHPFDLSGGELQRAALAKVMLLNPDILLLDEPTKGTHAHFKNTLAEIIDGLVSKGTAVITVTHDIEFAANSAHRVCMLFDGDTVAADTPRRHFGESTFYTTAAKRISDTAVTLDDLTLALEEKV